MNLMIEFDDDFLVDVLVDAIPDMTSEELSDLEFAISVELQERASQPRQLELFDDNY